MLSELWACIVRSIFPCLVLILLLSLLVVTAVSIRKLVLGRHMTRFRGNELAVAAV